MLPYAPEIVLRYYGSPCGADLARIFEGAHRRVLLDTKH